MRHDAIVITGTGMLTHLGRRDETLGALRAGRGRPFDPYARAVDVGCRCTRVGLIPEEVLADEALGITRKQSRFMGSASRMALVAAREALAQADLVGDRELAVIVGAGAGDTATHEEVGERLRVHGSARRLRPTVVPRLMASTVSANLVNVLRTRGPSASIAAACAGGAWNLIVGAGMIRDGLAERALVGGCESVDIHFHAGFDAMRAYCADADGTPDTASRPYAADRAGFIFGEGAGMLVLETRASAEARGAAILGVLRGWGASSDGEGEMVQPSRDGAARSMRAALRHAGVDAADVAYVNTHATSTPAGDIEEVHALRAVLGDVPYSSTKGYTGHMVSAAGSVEAAITLAFLAEGLAPGCRLEGAVDPELQAHPPLLSTTALSGTLALSNSFGFGGTNASLLFREL